jgi:hypothetical protein
MPEGIAESEARINAVKERVRREMTWIFWSSSPR